MQYNHYCRIEHLNKKCDIVLNTARRTHHHHPHHSPLASSLLSLMMLIIAVSLVKLPFCATFSIRSHSSASSSFFSLHCHSCILTLCLSLSLYASWMNMLMMIPYYMYMLSSSFVLQSQFAEFQQRFTAKVNLIFPVSDARIATMLHFFSFLFSLLLLLLLHSQFPESICDFYFYCDAAIKTICKNLILECFQMAQTATKVMHHAFSLSRFFTYI